MADDYGTIGGDQYEGGPYCKHCEQELDWEDCDACGGEGEYDAYEEDPLWFDPGDTEPCQQCGGAGGWYYCANRDCAGKVKVI
jgi:DnaJ-class molecular chaperone